MADEKTIRFDGVWLEDIAPDIKIDDITVSPISLTKTVNERPVRYGQDFVRNTGTKRTVTITFAIINDDRDEREAQLQAVRDWAKMDKEYTLVLPHHNKRHLECVCTDQPKASYRQWWENGLRVEFTCFNNPYWTSDDLVEAQCGQTFSVGGSAPPIMTIERRLVTSVSGQTYSNGSETMIFNRIPAGNMVIDLNRQTAKIGNNSFMEYFQPASTFITPKVGGRQIITGTGTIRFRERWV